MFSDTFSSLSLEDSVDVLSFKERMGESISVKGTRHLMYYCKATRPNIESSTKGQGIEPKTETLNLTCRTLPGTAIIKAKTTDETDSVTYGAWYTKVYEKSTDVESEV